MKYIQYKNTFFFFMKIIIHSYNTQHVEPSVTATIYADSCSTLMAGLWVWHLREEIPQFQSETSILHCGLALVGNLRRSNLSQLEQTLRDSPQPTNEQFLPLYLRSSVGSHSQAKEILKVPARWHFQHHSNSCLRYNGFANSMTKLIPKFLFFSENIKYSGQAQRQVQK